MDYPEFSDETLFAIDLALQAGDILSKGFYLPFKTFNKEGIHNIVTEYDLKSENSIIGSIKKKYKEASILSEEAGNNAKDSKMRWIIDPLDGTVNFAHRIPFFAVNIALEISSEIVSAVTFSPLIDELFIAEKGKGAYLNGKKINVSKVESLDNAFLATGFPYNLNSNPEKCIERFVDIIKTGIPIRRLGSAALDLAYLAAGRFDGYWETNLGAWDCAAGILLIEEAQGKISDWKGNKFILSPSNNSIVGSNVKIHEPLINILRKS